MIYAVIDTNVLVSALISQPTFGNSKGGETSTCWQFHAIV